MSHQTPAYMPPAVRLEVARLQDATDHSPKVEQLPANRWRITMENNRIHMQVTYRVVGKKGKLLWLSSSLTKDGVPCEIAQSFADFVRIFLRPDDEGENTIPEMTEIPLEQAPEIVQRLYAIAGRRVGDSARVGKEQDRWTISLEGAEQSVFRLYFVADADGAYQLDQNDPIRLLIGGYDYTEGSRVDFLRDPGRVMAQCIMAVTRGDFPPIESVSPLPVAQAWPASQGFSSADVRRTVVRRV